MERANILSEQTLKPCDYFDIIGGASTGGLIAVMLGRLEMDVDSCIDAYIHLSKSIFETKQKSRFNLFGRGKDAILVNGKFSSQRLEDAIKQITEEHTKNSEAPLWNPGGKCKVFVCVTRKENSAPACLRSYSNLTRGSDFHCTIWEAGRATSAASSFFDPIAIGPFGEQFIDGAMGRNNPVYEVLSEAKDIWQDADRRIQCLVSIGTGQPDLQEFGGNIVDIMKTIVRIATDTEDTARKFARENQELRNNGCYFRFNVDKGLAEVGLEEYKKMDVIAANTRRYLEGEEISGQIAGCSKSILGNSLCMPPTFADLEKQFDRNFETIRNWIRPPSYNSDYHHIKALRIGNTCRWVLERDEFKSWHQNLARVLWIHGKPGCGKSVIAATIVEMIQLHNARHLSTRHHLGYVFCNKKHEGERDPLTLMKILVWQIISRKDFDPYQMEVVLQASREVGDHNSIANPTLDSLQRLSPEILQRLFKRLIQPYESISLILDGMDECESPEQLIQWTVDLATASCEKQHLKLLVVSQNIREVEASLGLGSLMIPITKYDTAVDIVEYLNFKLPPSLPPSMNERIKSILLEKADGMFLWVSLAMLELTSIASLRSADEAKILRAIERIPRKINDLYLRLLERLFMSNKEISTEANAETQRETWLIMKWVLWSCRPLTLTELQAAVDLTYVHDTDPDSDPTPTNLANERDATTSIRESIYIHCIPLLSIQSNETVTVIHSTLKEFLEKRLGARSNDDKNFDFENHLQPPQFVHSDIAAVLLRYLRAEVFKDFIHYDQGDAFDLIKLQFPLYDYATKYWWLHVMNAPSPDDNNEGLYQQLVIFLKSDQAVTWLESYCRRPITAVNDLIMIQSGIRKWSNERGILRWVTDLLQKGQIVRKGRLGNDNITTLRATRNLASAYLNQGQWKEAQELQLQVMETTSKVLGREHPDTLTSIANLATIYHSKGQWKEAEKLFMQVIETRKRVLGQENPSTLSSIVSLASTYWSQGRWKEAEALEAQVMETSSRVLGQEHPATLATIAKLASTFKNQGRWKEAEKLFVQVMETRKRVLGEKHPDSLIGMANLASTYWNQGRWKEAEKLFTEVMMTSTRVLGEEHPDTLTIMVHLASTYRNQGRWKEAEDLFLQVMETSSRELGDDHPDIVTSVANLASTYSNRGQWAETEELDVQAMEIRKRVLGEDHRDTLSSITNLASTYMNQGRWKEVEELLSKAMETSTRILGREHPDTLISMNNLASTYRSQGRLKEAESLLVQSTEMRMRVLGREHPSTLTSITNLASVYWDLGRWKEAGELLYQVMETSKRVLGQEHPDTLTIAAKLASTYTNLGLWKEAEELYVLVIETRKRVFGQEHPDTLTSMANLAMTYCNQGRWQEAENSLIQVTENRKRVLGSEHPSTLTSLAILASTYSNQQRWKEAEEVERHVLESRKRVLGQDHPDTLTSIANLASTYWVQGQWKKAEELFVQVMDTSLRVLGPEHPDTLASMANVASTYKNQGQWKEAEELLVKVTEMSVRVLGQEHPHTLTSMSNLASTYTNQARWKEAEGLLMQVTETSAKVLGEEHPHTLTMMHSLACTQEAQGRIDEAIAVMLKVATISSRTLGEDHQYTKTWVELLRQWRGNVEIVD